MRAGATGVITLVTATIVSLAFVTALVEGVWRHDYTALKITSPMMLMQVGYAFGSSVISKGFVVRRLNGNGGGDGARPKEERWTHLP